MSLLLHAIVALVPYGEKSPVNSWNKRILFLLALGLLLAGCAGAGGAASSILAAVMATMLVVSCSDSNTAGQSDVVVSADTGECSGEWEKCCSNGVISNCCCPEGMACNYGMFETCADGSCSDVPDACPSDSDVIEADVPTLEDIAQTEDTTVKDTTVEDTTVQDTGENCDGQWEQCCLDGVVAKCCCPEGVACNYGMYKDCGEGICVSFEEDLCPGEKPDVSDSKDVTSIDAVEGCSGAWEACCKDGNITQCCCPAGAECSYDWFDDCGDNICAEPGQCTEVPPEDVVEPPSDLSSNDISSKDVPSTEVSEPDTLGECSGFWESCCQQGKIEMCCCPEGVACNYGMYTKCSETTCVGPVDLCPDAPKKDPEPQQ